MHTFFAYQSFSCVSPKPDTIGSHGQQVICSTARSLEVTMQTHHAATSSQWKILSAEPARKVKKVSKTTPSETFGPADNAVPRVIN